MIYSILNIYIYTLYCIWYCRVTCHELEKLKAAFQSPTISGRRFWLSHHAQLT